jgi:penicillin-binding protein 1A
LRDLFPEDWRPNFKKRMLGLDAWVDFSLFRSASGARESYERFSTFMDRFHVAGWRRGLNELVSEGATLGRPARCCWPWQCGVPRTRTTTG